PGPAPCALTDTSAVIGPPVRPDLSAISARGSGSKLPALAPAGHALPSFHSTASGLMSHIIAARFFNSSTTFSAAWSLARRLHRRHWSHAPLPSWPLRRRRIVLPVVGPGS